MLLQGESLKTEKLNQSSLPASDELEQTDNVTETSNCDLKSHPDVCVHKVQFLYLFL